MKVNRHLPPITKPMMCGDWTKVGKMRFTCEEKPNHEGRHIGRRESRPRYGGIIKNNLIIVEWINSKAPFMDYRRG